VTPSRREHLPNIGNTVGRATKSLLIALGWGLNEKSLEAQEFRSARTTRCVGAVSFCAPFLQKMSKKEATINDAADESELL
jgi:hypothetical protein